MNKEELKERTKKFALRIINLVKALPKNNVGFVVGGQLLRCGTSVASNYRAVCRSRSRAEFISKLGVVIEEADESAFWIEIIIEAELVDQKLVENLLKEANEITAIMVASRKSASNIQS
jgi:four helix bundle protein